MRNLKENRLNKICRVGRFYWFGFLLQMVWMKEYTDMMTIILLLTLLIPTRADSACERQLAEVFAEAKVKGTMIIASLDGRQICRWNAERAEKRYPAASTFKIFNSLIALEEGVIDGPEGRFKWDGTVHSIADWNRDQTLLSAYRVSCVWCYQDLARRIGVERYRRHLRRAGYGELREPFDLTRFWLDGSLRVSAREQITFLRKVITRSLPYRAESYDKLREVMLMERGPGFELRAKTGWGTAVTPGIGWYIGYVEAKGQVWIFALNIDIRGDGDLPRRVELAKAALRAGGMLP